jgi:hypothetical protein
VDHISTNAQAKQAHALATASTCMFCLVNLQQWTDDGGALALEKKHDYKPDKRLG